MPAGQDLRAESFWCGPYALLQSDYRLEPTLICVGRCVNRGGEPTRAHSTKNARSRKGHAGEQILANVRRPQHPSGLERAWLQPCRNQDKITRASVPEGSASREIGGRRGELRGSSSSGAPCFFLDRFNLDANQKERQTQKTCDCAEAEHKLYESWIFIKVLEARAGIEPAHKGFADLSLTTWVPRLGRDARVRAVASNLKTLPKLPAEKVWSGRRDLNSRPSPWQGDALPLSYSRSTCLILQGW